jgi:hypothetical protein
MQRRIMSQQELGIFEIHSHQSEILWLRLEGVAPAHISCCNALAR